jgi:hypothetical protein
VKWRDLNVGEANIVGTLEKRDALRPEVQRALEAYGFDSLSVAYYEQRSNGGARPRFTVALVDVAEPGAEGEIFVGATMCSPNDEFNRETGRIIAFDRAVRVRDTSTVADNGPQEETA